MKTKFEEMRHPEIGELIKKNGMVIIPIGACEEHGRHLPVNTDTEIAYRAAIDAAEKVKEEIPVAVLPAVWFGYTVSVLKNWPGVITVDPKVLIDLLCDICKSLIDMKIKKILFVNGHGGNPGVLDVVAKLVGDRHKVFPGVTGVFGMWDRKYIDEHRKSKEGGIGHACEVETSLMMYLTDLADMTVADDTDIMKTDLRNCPVDFASEKKKRLYLSTWYLEDSIYGGAGDPTCASREFGEAIHKMTVDGLADVIKEFYDIQVKLENRKLSRECQKF
ncbi:MAG: creatininase family protein [Candidatus Humimicrobiaceae bacterium]